MRWMSMDRVVVSLLGVAGCVALFPREASACGGMFCDAGPTPMPVDQTGENILFVRDGDTIEAHIQIQYTGEAAQFGWVIPVQSVPELSVGSEPLFRALLDASVPQYGFSRTFDDCGNNGGFSSTDPATTDPATTDPSTSMGDGTGGGPEIVLTQTVGAFEITVLEGGTGQEVLDWLDANGYQQDDEALPILDAYLAEGHLFAAVRLTGEAGVEEIHPIVLRFQGTEPCVPLRLTRIAAVDDMGVRSFFLGGGRTVPLNYRHVVVNDLKVNWLSPTNYANVITMAVDEENANGRAFVTEYAGSSAIVPRAGLYDGSWFPEAFVDRPVDTVGELLVEQDLLTCVGFDVGCSFTHPLVEPLLLEYVTPPPDIPAAYYWANQAEFPEVDLSAWDGAAFAAALATRVVEPGQHADQLLTDHPYLTRMYTRISPAEMTEDPEFHENFALPEVPATRNGTLRMLCNFDGVFIFPDGRELYLPNGSQWPQLPDVPNGVDGSMPAAEIVEEVPGAGAPIALTDNFDAIEAVRIAWNEAHDWPGDGVGTGSSDSTGGAADGEPGGCGCSTTPPSAWSFASLLLLALATRGPRARDRSPAADR